MPLIKRYSNRKLYDTEARRYVTLDALAEIIRRGGEVRVADHATGEDLTALTLAQVILGQERRPGGRLPHAVLTGLIQAGSDTLNVLRGALTSPAELMDLADAEIERRIELLVEREELSAGEGERLAKLLLALSEPAQRSLALSEQMLRQALDRRGVPSREDLRQLLQQVEALAAELDSLDRSQ